MKTEDVLQKTLFSTPPNTRAALEYYNIVNVIVDDVIRISTWLTVTMVLIRYLVLKFASRPSRLQKIQSFHLGFHVFGVAACISTFISWLLYLREDIVLIGQWKPAEHCPDASKYSPQPIYDIVPSTFFKAHNGLLLRIFMLSNGLVSSILPCCLLPTLTGLLILELRRTKRGSKSFDKNRLVSYHSLSPESSSTERTTGLVILMTVLYFIALLPSGIMSSLLVAYTDIGFL